MDPTALMKGAITQLASPVKVGTGDDRRFGMLIASGSRLQLRTETGLEFDVDRNELVGAKADINPLPKVTLTVQGRQYRLPLVAGTSRHDVTGLIAQLRSQPHYAQQASAVPRWQRWLAPPSAQELAAHELALQMRERADAFVRDQIAAPGRLQTPVWHYGNVRIAQLAFAADELVLNEVDGTQVRLGSVSNARITWSGSGTKAVLGIRTAGGDVMVTFRPPKQKGGSGWDTAEDPLAFLLAVPVYGVVSLGEKAAVLRRIKRWRDALDRPGTR